MNDRHQTKPYPLRMSEELRGRLEEAAKEMGRSLNAEIVLRLESSLTPPPVEEVHRDFLSDVIFSSFDDEEDAALGEIDRSSVDGMVAWLELVDTYRERRAKLEGMINEALEIYEKRKSAPKVNTEIKAVKRAPKKPRKS